jgi:D-methionine transport system substrate-binding protein
MLVLAVKGKDKQQPWTLALADAFRAPEFKAVLVQKFPGYARPAFLQ